METRPANRQPVKVADILNEYKIPPKALNNQHGDITRFLTPSTTPLSCLPRHPYFIGYRASAAQKKKRNETLFLAGHSLGWTSIGFTCGHQCRSFMLLASASIGYTTAWWPEILPVCLRVYFHALHVFAPRYLAAKVSTMPEYNGPPLLAVHPQHLAGMHLSRSYLLALVSLFAAASGSPDIDIPMWESVIAMVLFAGLFAFRRRSPRHRPG